MGGALGGLLAVVEAVGGLLLALLIGTRALGGRGQGWRLLFGSLAIGVVSVLAYEAYMGYSLSLLRLVFVPIGLYMVVLFFWAIGEDFKGR